MPTPETGRDLKVFLANQASFEEPDGNNAGEGWPVTGNAVRAITASANGELPWEDREDQFGTASPIRGVALKATAEASVEGYWCASGARNSAPPMDTLLSGSGWVKTDSSGGDTTTLGTASTTTVINVQTGQGANFTVGGSIMVEVETGSEFYELRRIKSIATDAITIHPPLKAAASTAGLKVKGGICYAPDDNRDKNETSLCMWVANGNSCDRVGGWTPGEIGVTLGGDGPAKWTASGTARQHLRQISANLQNSGGVNNSQTDFEIDNGFAMGATDLAGENTYWQIENEIVKVEFVDLESSPFTATVVRGALSTSAASHAQYKELRPLAIDTPFGGPNVAPSAGFFSQVVFSHGPNDPNVQSLQIGTMTINASSPLAYIEDQYGDTQKVAGFVSSKRDISMSLSGWSYPGLIHNSQGWSSPQTGVKSVMIQNGTDEGNMFGFFAPHINPSQVSLDRGAEIITVEISGKCYGSEAGADDLFFLFG